MNPTTRTVARCLRLAVVMLACGHAGSAQQTQHPVARKRPAQAPAAPPVATLLQAMRENNLGLALMDRHDYPGALGRFQTACVMNPESDAGCLNMGIALLSMSRYDDARQILAKSVERDRNNPRPWYSLGLVERALGNLDAARESFQKAAAIDPDDAG